MSADERTIVFGDIAGSTRIMETAGDVLGHEIVASCLDCLSDVTHHYGGRVVKTIGDEVMSAFEAPDSALCAAVEMQRALAVREPMHGIKPRVRIGVHGGAVLMSAGDLHGDVVNTAARVVAMAHADQIITTDDTLRAAKGFHMAQRDLGEHPLKGKDQPVRLREILWEATTSLTIVQSSPLQAGRAALRLGSPDGTFTLVASQHEPVTMGRGEGNTIEIRDDAASRYHASISARYGRFYLADRSTNGTYVRPEGAPELFVHRDEVLLHGTGEVRLGRAAAEGEGPVIEYGVGEE